MVMRGGERTCLHVRLMTSSKVFIGETVFHLSKWECRKHSHPCQHGVYHTSNWSPSHQNANARAITSPPCSQTLQSGCKHCVSRPLQKRYWWRHFPTFSTPHYRGHQHKHNEPAFSAIRARVAKLLPWKDWNDSKRVSNLCKAHPHRIFWTRCRRSTNLGALESLCKDQEMCRIIFGKNSTGQRHVRITQHKHN